MTDSLSGFAVLGIALMLGACASMQSAPPATSFDGLTLVPDTKFDAVYRNPEADFGHYTEFGVTPCEVAFRKNWLRDQNSDRLDLTNRVTQKDVDRIKDSLAEDCEKMFREALAQDPAYTVVEQFSEGEQVLVLRPGIANLDVSGPDVRSSGMNRTYTTSAGQMTLVLELVDATTGDVLARVVDSQQDFDTARMQWTNSVTNRAAADRILRMWAKRLREGLDRIREAS